jgi:hypothetical protein
MAHRSFSITLPADTNSHNLYTEMLAQSGAIPTSGILPDRGCGLKIICDLGSGAATVTVLDNTTTSGGQILNAGDIFERNTVRNSICFQDYNLKGSTNSMVVKVDVEFV